MKSTSTFLWRERRGNLATHHGGEKEKVCVEIHGGKWSGRKVLVKMEKREVERKCEKREKMEVRICHK